MKDQRRPSDGLALEFEDCAWVPAVEIPRRHRITYAGPYRAAIPAKIAERDFPLGSDVVELVSDAGVEIARFDAEHGASDIAPLPAVLLRSESVASSKIENLTASAKAVALAELGDRSKKNASVIVSNVNAMRAAIALSEDLGEQAIFDMHTALLGDEHPEWCGRWRDQQVWIGGSDYGPHTATFVPPAPHRVPDAMRDLVACLRRDDLAPIVHMAVTHAQFETIHPFPDGNGRTGRALVHSLMRHRGLTRTVTVPLSAGLLTDITAYFDALTAYRAGDHVPIVTQFAQAAHLGVHNGRRLIADLQDVRATWATLIHSRRDAASRRLADLLLRHPAVDSALVQRELGVSTPTALTAITELEAAGILREVTSGRYSRKWVAADVVAALDSYAAHGGRRARPAAHGDRASQGTTPVVE